MYFSHLTTHMKNSIMPFLATVNISRGNITIDPDYQNVNTTNFQLAIIIAPIMLFASFGNIMDTIIESSNEYWSTMQMPTTIAFLWRLSMTLYCWTTIAIMLWWYGPIGFAFFTVWNWSIITLYMTLGSLRYFHPNETRLTIIHQCFGELELSSSWLVALVVWTYLGPHSKWNPMFMDYVGISMHACNAIIMTVDVFLIQDLKMDYEHFAIICLWASAYLTFHLIANMACGFMAYPFLHTDDPLFFLYILALFSVLIAMYVFSCFVYQKCKGPARTLNPLKLQMNVLH